MIHCVKGTKRKYFVDKPLVPSMWPVRIGTDLTQFEVTTLEELGFVLCEACKCAPRTLFANESTTPPNWPADPEAWPKIRNNKLIKRTITFKLSTQQTNRWEAGWTLEAVVLPPIEVPPLTYGQIYIISFNPPLSTKQFEVTIGNFHNCTCVDFITMMVGSLGGQGKWVHCKHFYFILQNVTYCGQTEPFIHFLTWSWDEVQPLTSHVRVIFFD